MDHPSFANEVVTISEMIGIISMAVGLVFGYAAMSKLLDVPALVAGIRDYRIVPARLAPISAGILIAGESLIALAHLTGTGFRFVAPATIVLLSIFFAVTASLLIRGDKRPCLCFGAHREEPVDLSGLIRISILWLAEGLLYLLLIGNDDPMPEHTWSANSGAQSLMVATLVVSLAGWCLAAPKLHIAWSIVRS